MAAQVRQMPAPPRVGLAWQVYIFGTWLNYAMRLQSPRVRARAAKAATCLPATAAERHRALTWAQRLKRVFQLDLEHCPHCGGPLQLIASLDGRVMQKLVKHLEARRPPGEVAVAR